MATQRLQQLLTATNNDTLHHSKTLNGLKQMETKPTIETNSSPFPLTVPSTASNNTVHLKSSTSIGGTGLKRKRNFSKLIDQNDFL